MMQATPVQKPHDAGAKRSPRALTERAQFDAFFADWFPRVYRLAARRLRDRWAAEAATRAALEAAIQAGLAGASALVAPRMLALALREIARADRAHGFVTGTPRAAP